MKTVGQIPFPKPAMYDSLCHGVSLVVYHHPLLVSFFFSFFLVTCGLNGVERSAGTEHLLLYGGATALGVGVRRVNE